MALPIGKEPETEADLEAVEPRSNAIAGHLHIEDVAGEGGGAFQRCVKFGRYKKEGLCLENPGFHNLAGC